MATKSKKKKKRAASSKKKKTASKKCLNKKTVIIIVAAAVIAIAGIVTAAVISGNRQKPNKISLSGDTAMGIDVSSHNGKINWKKVKDEAEFAFIRVGYRGYTEGEINGDKRAKENLESANKNEIPVGVYFYSQAVDTAEAEEEARFVLSVIKDYTISLPVVIDYEYAMDKSDNNTGRLYDASHTRKERTAVINAFCDVIREAGYTPGVYASSYIYRTELIMRKIPDDVFIWVADYNKNVTYMGYYDIWQYTNEGSCSGVNSKNVDLNYFYVSKRANKE